MLGIVWVVSVVWCGCGARMLEGGMKFRGVRRVPLFQSCDGFCKPMNAGRVKGSGRDWTRDDASVGMSGREKEALMLSATTFRLARID